jgi:hypothetical protein
MLCGPSRCPGAKVVPTMARPAPAASRSTDRISLLVIILVRPFARTGEKERNKEGGDTSRALQKILLAPSFRVKGVFLSNMTDELDEQFLDLSQCPQIAGNCGTPPMRL